MLTGTLIEVFNANVYQFWIFNYPWDTFTIPYLNVSATAIFIGWLMFSAIALLFTLFYEKLRPDKNIERAWVIGWVIAGTLVEVINAKFWQSWILLDKTVFGRYPIPFLDISIFVPLLGYTGIGIFSFWIIRILIMHFNKKDYKLIK